MKKIRPRTVFLLILFVVFAVIALRQNLTVRRYTVSAQDGDFSARFAVITDLHSTKYGKNQKTLLRALRKENPDAILFVGDIVDDKRATDSVKALLAAIGTEFPCYYVTGNHEFRTESIDKVKELFRDYGVTVLSGDAVRFSAGGRDFLIAGIDDPEGFSDSFFGTECIDAGWRTQLAAVKSAAENTDAYTILLSHRPDLMDFYKNSGFDLVLCGHAHGGQVRIPFLMNGLYAPGQGLFPKYAGGMYTLDGDVTMIVSRGLCRNLLPRVFNPPELVMVEIGE